MDASVFIPLAFAIVALALNAAYRTWHKLSLGRALKRTGSRTSAIIDAAATGSPAATLALRG